jgi:exportin-7
MTSRQRLDIALLHFFQHFRKVYVGEVVMHATKVYERLRETVGIDDHLALLDVILRKVIHNLKVSTTPIPAIPLCLCCTESRSVSPAES